MKGIEGKTRRDRVRNPYIREELKMIYRIKLREIDRGALDRAKDWISIQYQKDYWK
jgi:hypothetical protein